MNSDADANQAHLQRFQELLRELFQFDCADLDFGIYRIMNHKRDAIERFISEELPARILGELNSGHIARQSQAAEELQEARANLEAALGKDALYADGKLDDRYSTTPFGLRYLEAQAAAEPRRNRDVVETDIYNHLYTFFRRYYQDGDFISRRRYSRNHRYAIPYNGEEVYLHWANSDQYYVKTAEHFHNYDWTAPNGVSVRFRLEAANVEQNNVRGDKRFFVPLEEKMAWDAAARAVTVSFEYRPLTVEERNRHGTRNQQAKIIADADSVIPQLMYDAPDALAALTGEYRRSGNDEPVSHLEHHLRQYTRRNDSDFFIHKDLRGFLSRELDFYLKNEVLNLDNLEAAGEQAPDGWFQQMRLIKSVGSEIIDFLAQIENFQKLLWEKRKFVVDTQYCITLGNVSPDFYAEIIDNNAQWKEWNQLLGIVNADRSASFLKDRPTLPLDTRHFSAEFTDRLLATVTDLDGMTDGVLIHSENWQALNSIQDKYAGSLDCVYTDPPYNTTENTFLYKNNYRHSSWIAMISDRIQLGCRFLTSGGVFQIAINDTETQYLRAILDSHFGQDNRVATIVAEVNPAGQNLRPNTPALSHDYCHVYSTDISRMTMLMRELSPSEKQGYPERDISGPYLWDNLRRRGGNSRPADRPGQVFPLFVKGDTVRIPDMSWDESDKEWLVQEAPQDGETAILPIDPKGEARIWRMNPDGARRDIEEGNISVITKAGRREIVKKSYMPAGRKPKTVWYDSKYSATTYGTKLLNDILGAQKFSYPKSVYLLMDCLQYWMHGKATVADYFAGSGTTGHAVINLNREDGGQRKFILVEMGEYFDTVLLPRIKRVTFSPQWKDGRPKRDATPEEAERSPRIVKYMRLESYEDALDSIAFDDETGHLDLEKRIDSYLLKYMLRWETKQSETLLNAAKLTRPFDYRLRGHAQGVTRERNADLAETFNYLLGLNVRTRRVYDDDGRRYLVYRGETRESPGKSVAVIWRETEGWSQEDFARDREFVKEKKLDGVDGHGIRKRRLRYSRRQGDRAAVQGEDVRRGIRLMPRRSRANQGPNNARSYARLELRLTLLSWLHALLGYADTKGLLDDIRPAREGFDGDGRSYICQRLSSRDGLKIPPADLKRYDDNIREHLAGMNAGRTLPITLRYFQYLAALYTEMFLDRYDQSPAALLASLNRHVGALNSNLRAGEPAERYEESDLNKLAFWMATGSGKTLLLHLNYRQFLHYNREPLDNILLITPNDGLTQQHLDELEASGIPARRLDLNESTLFGQEARHDQSDRNNQVGDGKAGRGRDRAGGGLRGLQPDLRRRGAQGFRWGGVARGARRAGSNWVHFRVQRNVRAGAHGRQKRRPHDRVRQGYRVRLLLPLLLRRRLRQGLSQILNLQQGDDGWAHGHPAASKPVVVLRAAVGLFQPVSGTSSLQLGETAVGVRGQQRQCRPH